MAFGSARGVQPLQAPLTVPRGLNIPQSCKITLKPHGYPSPPEIQGTATKAGSLRLSLSHTGVTQGWVAGTGHEWCQHNCRVLEAEDEKEKPGLSHFLGLYPKGRGTGHLLGRTQLSWSQLGGKVGEERRKWERSG